MSKKQERFWKFYFQQEQKKLYGKAYAEEWVGRGTQRRASLSKHNWSFHRMQHSNCLPLGKCLDLTKPLFHLCKMGQW